MARGYQSFNKSSQVTRELGPLVSIVTPSFNQGHFIEDTILSIKNQTYPNIEHIIVDGGSTDKTIEILKKYEGTYEMYWVSEPDEGQADAINKGFSMARGEIVTWLNSDDVYFDKMVIADVVKVFHDFKNVQVIYGDIVVLSEHNIIKKVYCVSSFNYNKLFRSCFIAQPALFFRKEVIKQHKLRKDLQYVFDYEFWLRIGKIYKFQHISRIIAADRNHPKRKMLTQDAKIELRRLLNEYGYEREGVPFKLLRAWDILSSSLPRKLKSLLLMAYLYFFFPEEKLAIQARFDNFLSCMWNQLFVKNINIF